MGLPAISASTKRLIILTVASALLLAAGNVPEADTPVTHSIDSILAPLTPADAAASAAALAATTPADVAAAALAAVADDDAVAAGGVAAAPRPARLTALIAAMDPAEAGIASDRNLRCLATAVYFESRGEPLEGQLAVAQAILNRVASGRYPSSVCGVVEQPRQFSFDRSRAPRAGSDWSTAQAIARIAIDDKWHAVAPKAMSFHATYVSPNWRGKTRVAQIGRHVFYK